MAPKKKTTTKKKTGSRPGKKTQASRQHHALNLSEHTTYLILGIMISFVALLGLFQWGALGALIVNGFRLLVGETYALLLAPILALGLYMMVKGQLFVVRLQHFLGGIMTLTALTSLLHVNQFIGQEPLPQSIFSMTYQIFRNEVLMGQVRVPMGGGMLGAITYATFGYLFGKWGTYLLVVILFLAGFSLLLNLPWQAWQGLFARMSTGVQGLSRRLFPPSQATEEEPAKQVFYSEDDVEAAPQAPSRSSSRKLSLSERFFGFVEEEDQEPGLEDSDHNLPNRLRRRPLANWDEEETSRSQAPVLDLDYLEGQDAQEDTVPIVIANAHQAEADWESEDNVFDIEPAPVSDLASVDPELEPSKPLAPAADAAAGHWQAQAHERADLTRDDLDSQLDQMAEQEGPQAPVVIKKPRAHKPYQLPGKNLLKKIPPVDQSEEYARINENIAKLERTFESFGVQAKVVKANLGPSVTKYEIQPSIGVKVSKIVSLSDDIALALAARDVRMEAPIPGKSLIGIEVPNTQVSPVSFWEIIDAALESKHILEVPLGRDISGVVCLADLSKMPHLLIAGATGSGKSVGMNVIITSLLMKAKPDEVKFLMIDPKKVELTMYDGVPHLLAPVVTNPRKAAQALNKVVQEMERRYELFAATGVRNIDGYNEQVDNYNKEQGTGYEAMPKIVVFIDELADLMMVASNEVESAIIRLAQMARAAGIHMIIATQRPSVDVITGIIKANVPSRLAFAVSSSIDSRTILDSNGAEKLLGRGDMLFQPMGKNKPVRVQGAYISDSEVEKITEFVKNQQEAEYDETMMVSDDETGGAASASDDEYFGEAVELIRGLETISISQLQRKFRIGYNRAARLIDDLEAQGFIGPQDGSKPRQVFVQAD